MLCNERMLKPNKNLHMSGKQLFFLKKGYEVIETGTSDLIVKMQKSF